MSFYKKTPFLELLETPASLTQEYTNVTLPFNPPDYFAFQ